MSLPEPVTKNGRVHEYMVEEKGAITFLMSDILGVLAAPKDLIAFNWSFKLANEEVNCCQVVWIDDFT